jgi:hypothetical protein
MTGSKIIKSGGAEPDEFEKQIAQALLELEMNSDLRQQLRELNITRAREIEFGAKKVRNAQILSKFLLFSCYLLRSYQ